MPFACQLDRQFAKQVEELRIAEYRRSDDFDLIEQDKLRWDPVDESSIVLGICGDEGVRSTMRATVARHFEQAESLAELPLPDHFFDGHNDTLVTTVAEWIAGL